MAMPQVHHEEAILAKALREFEMDWEMTAHRWRDRARSGFEKTFLDQLIPEVRRAGDAITHINRILDKAIRECR